MVNYIVSGVERSGTSMMMQILHAGGAKVAFDTSRKPDYHNPKGYYELEGGKVINRLMDGTFPLERYDDMFIKITAYGLKFLPPGDYKIIYMLRNLDEVMDSMERMSGPIDREKEKPLFEKLNRFAIGFMKRRDDVDYITVQYRNVVENPNAEVTRINEFLGGMLDVESAVRVVNQRFTGM